MRAQSLGLRLAVIEVTESILEMEAAAPGADVELMCKTLQVDHKLFYFDFKENPRGHYLKISEKTSGSRSTIIVPMAGVVWFVDLFNYYANGEDPEFFSKELQLNTKVIFPLLYRLGSCGSASSNSPLVQAHCCFSVFHCPISPCQKIDKLNMTWSLVPHVV